MDLVEDIPPFRALLISKLAEVFGFDLKEGRSYHSKNYFLRCSYDCEKILDSIRFNGNDPNLCLPIILKLIRSKDNSVYKDILLWFRQPVDRTEYLISHL